MTEIPIWMEVAINDLGLTEADFRRLFKARRSRIVKPLYVKNTHTSCVMGDDNVVPYHLAKVSVGPNAQSWKAKSVKTVMSHISYDLCDED